MRKYLLEHYEESSIFIFFFAKVDSQQHYLFGSDRNDDQEDDGDGDIFDNDADDKNDYHYYNYYYDYDHLIDYDYDYDYDYDRLIILTSLL